MIEKNLIGRLEMGIEKWELLVHASVSESVRVKRERDGREEPRRECRETARNLLAEYGTDRTIYKMHCIMDSEL
jgi:hypothetical protein